MKYDKWDARQFAKLLQYDPKTAYEYRNKILGDAIPEQYLDKKVEEVEEVVEVVEPIVTKEPTEEIKEEVIEKVEEVEPIVEVEPKKEVKKAVKRRKKAVKTK